MSKGAKHPDRTGMRCLICYAWEIKDAKTNRTYLEHEEHCPDRHR